MSFTLLSFPVVFAFFVIALIGTYNGAGMGFPRALISLGSDVSALFLSFFATALLSDFIAAMIMKTVEGLSIYADFAGILPSLSSVLSAALSMLLGTVLYIFVFLFFRIAVRRIALGVYRRRAGSRDDGDAHGSRLKGAVCGFLSSVLLVSALNAPVMGSLVLADNALHIIKQTNTTVYQALGPGNAVMVHEFTEDISSGLFYYAVGGKGIYANAGSTYVDGDKFYLLSEVQTVSSMSADMLSVYEIFLKPQEATAAHADALRRLSGNMRNLKLCKALSAEVISGCVAAWQNGERFLTICRPEVPSVWAPVFDGVLGACADVTVSDVDRNTATMLGAYALILESGVCAAPAGDSAAVLLCLSDGETLGKLEALLLENPDTAHIGVSEVAMSAFAPAVLHGEASPDGLISEIAEALGAINASELPANEKEEALAEALRSVLENCGLSASSAFTRYAARQMQKELPGRSVDENDVARLLEKYDISVS